MIAVLAARTDEDLPSALWHQYLHGLPPAMRERILRFRLPRDRNAALMGKLLLIKILESDGKSAEWLMELRYTPKGRPFLPDQNIDFNISHSGHFVVCAAACGPRVGIDVEAVRSLPLSDFKDVLTDAEWKIVDSSADPCGTFLRFWTIKESVLKADGGGLSIPLKKVSATNNCEILLAGTVWHVHEVLLDTGHICHLACNQPSPCVKMERITFSI